jgi:tetratricopeptide (TPR) repeat protein
LSPSFYGHEFRKVARDLDADRATVRAIQAVAQGGDLARAIAMAQAALDDGQEHPLLLNFCALQREQEGRHDAALALLCRAAAIAPTDIGTLNALGLCLHRLERHEEALAAFDALVRVDATLAFAHANRAGTELARGRLDRAELGYRRALDLQPGLLTALSGLGAIAVQRGAHAEAVALAHQALAIEPSFPEATLSLAAAELALGQAAQAEGRVRALIAEPRLSRLERAHAIHLLGDILDAQDQAGAAFEAYRAANVELKALYAPRFAQGQSSLGYIRDLIDYFDRTGPEAWSRRTAPSAGRPGPVGHVFLVSFPGSEARLSGGVLASHPGMVMLRDQDTLIDGTRSFMRTPSNLDRLAGAAEHELAPLRAAYWRRVEDASAVGLDGRTLVDAAGVGALPLIARLFPEARILLVRRDPRDVVLESFRRRFPMNATTYRLLDLNDAAALYDATETLAALLGPALGLAAHEVRYEALSSDLEIEARAACTFLGLTWTEPMGEVAARPSTPSAGQPWRRYAGQMAPVMARLAPWVARYGYPPA